MKEEKTAVVIVCLSQRWLTSPVRRLSQGKADGQKKPPIRTRRRDNRQELTTPLTGNAQTVQEHTHTIVFRGPWSSIWTSLGINVSVSAEAEEGGGGAERRRGGARGGKPHPSTTAHADHQRPKQPRGKQGETDCFSGFPQVSIRGKWTRVYFLLSSLQALDSDQGSNESDTEQRNKALRGRM